MQVKTILDVIDYIRKAMDDTKLIDVYHKFSILADSSIHSPEQALLFERQKDVIIELQKKIEPQKWDYSKYKIFKEINQNNLLGESAIDEMNALFELNKNAFHNLVEPLQLVLSELTALYEIVSLRNPIIEIQKKYFPVSELEITAKNIVYFYCEGNVSIKDLNGLGRFSRIWDNILLTLHELTGESPEEIQIVSIDKLHSGFYCGVGVGERTIQSLFLAINSILDEYAKIYKIRKVQLDVITLKLTNEIIGMLEKEVQACIHEKSLNIVKALLDKASSSIDKAEMNEKLMIVIRQISDFIEKGGEINFESTKIEMEQNHILNNNYDFVGQIKELVTETEQYV